MRTTSPFMEHNSLLVLLLFAVTASSTTLAFDLLNASSSAGGSGDALELWNEIDRELVMDRRCDSVEFATVDDIFVAGENVAVMMRCLDEAGVPMSM